MASLVDVMSDEDEADEEDDDDKVADSPALAVLGVLFVLLFVRARYCSNKSLGTS